MKSSDVRQRFLDFFRSKQHDIVASAPIVLKDDPTLMFTNSGMNQFKDLFLGISDVKQTRIADSQKCLRVSGKHNDLDDVGKDTYHHTMFEMLGNWSFGDYFKEEAIAWAWELLTEVYGIDKENLYVTVFEGDAGDGLNKDQEAHDIWKKYIPEDRILNGDKKDNFWEMGETGPCGPCSEIHIDIRPLPEKEKVSGKALVNQDHPQVIEIWNLVFMQYLRKADQSLEELPAKHIDTGMGFERLCMVLQDKQSNYDTDVFQPLIQKIEAHTSKKYGSNHEVDVAIRVVVDHLRAVAFAIADGQLPGNNGAAYVIRRILRRAVSYAYRFLDVREAFIYRLLEVLEAEMGAFYPELIKQRELISNVIREEEQSFIATISSGLDKIEQLIQDQKSQDSKILSGEKIFELYDTYGFPADLSRIIAEEQGFQIDEDGFEKELAKQKERSRKAGGFSTGDWVDLSQGEVRFTGYEHTLETTRLLKYRSIEMKGKKLYQMVIQDSPFYPEGGGQVGDRGSLMFGDEEISVLDTKKENNLPVLFTEKLPSDPTKELVAKVNEKLRRATQRNHTATHLLHFALRKILGEHVAQRGSFVGPDYLRFDFSHFSKLEPKEIQAVEDEVNRLILEGISLQEQRSIPFDEAVAKGAMALFGEKYEANVRMIQFGESKELCGGTHVANTAEIGLFVLLSDSSSAAGIRRIEAITGEKAYAAFKEQRGAIEEARALLKSDELLKPLEKALKEKAEIEKELDTYKEQERKQASLNLVNQFKEHDGIEYLVTEVALDANDIKSLMHQWRKEKDNRLMVLAARAGEKVIVTVAASDALSQEKGIDVRTIIKEMSGAIKGGGGGQPFFATAGGKNPAGINEALKIAENYITRL